MAQIIAFCDFNNFSTLLRHPDEMGFGDLPNPGIFYFFEIQERTWAWYEHPEVCNGQCNQLCEFCERCDGADIILAPDDGIPWLYLPKKNFKFLRHSQTLPNRYDHLLASPNLKGYEFSREELYTPYHSLAQELEGNTEISTWNIIKDFDRLKEIALVLMERFGCNDDFRTEVVNVSANLSPDIQYLLNWNDGTLGNFIAKNGGEELEFQVLAKFIVETFFKEK